eukprot:Sspe_Gene.6784::Locus_2281_Transcript_1_1_Confidence_1.000_Length_2013::g.6784::m.6784
MGSATGVAVLVAAVLLLGAEGRRWRPGKNYKNLDADIGKTGGYWRPPTTAMWTDKVARERGPPPYVPPKDWVYNTTAGPVAGKINVHLVPHTHDDTGWQVRRWTSTSTVRCTTLWTRWWNGCSRTRTGGSVRGDGVLRPVVGPAAGAAEEPDADAGGGGAAGVRERGVVHARRGEPVLGGDGGPDDAGAPVPEEALRGEGGAEGDVADRPVRALEHERVADRGGERDGLRVLGADGLPGLRDAQAAEAVGVDLGGERVAGVVGADLRGGAVRGRGGRVRDVDRVRRERPAGAGRPVAARLQRGQVGGPVRAARAGAGELDADGAPDVGVRVGLPVPERDPLVPEPGQADPLREPERDGERLLLDADAVRGGEAEGGGDVGGAARRHLPAGGQRAPLLDGVLHVAPGAEAAGARGVELPERGAAAGGGVEDDEGGGERADDAPQPGGGDELDGLAGGDGGGGDAPRRDVGDGARGREQRLRAADQRVAHRGGGGGGAVAAEAAGDERDAVALQLQLDGCGGLPEHHGVRGDDGDGGVLGGGVEPAGAEHDPGAAGPGDGGGVERGGGGDGAGGGVADGGAGRADEGAPAAVPQLVQDVAGRGGAVEGGEQQQGGPRPELRGGRPADGVLGVHGTAREDDDDEDGDEDED